MNLLAYRVITALALPFFAYAGWKRCRQHRKSSPPDLPAIDFCLRSRFGLNPTPVQSGGVWIHAVSVGETRSIFPLLSAIKQHYPDLPLTVTNGSIQGAVQALQFAPVPIQHQMLPFDYPFAVRRFLDKLKPKLVLMVETEIWPNLYQACQERDIPVALINGRLKEKSFHAYQKWGGKLVAQALNQTEFIAAQFPIDSKRFQALGADPDKIHTLGNLKFDLTLDPELPQQAQQWRQDNHTTERLTWVAASTHAHPTPGEPCEEQPLIQAHRTLLKQQPDALLILVPRHADRFDEVANLLDESGLRWQRRSQDPTIKKNTQIYLADSVGELMLFFAASDIAFVGGSLVPFGGHNILEPAALNKPVISGRHFANLQALFEPFVAQHAISIVDHADDLAQQILQFSRKPDLVKNQVKQARHCFQQQTGALQKTLARIQPYLDDAEKTPLERG